MFFISTQILVFNQGLRGRDVDPLLGRSALPAIGSFQRSDTFAVTQLVGKRVGRFNRGQVGNCDAVLDFPFSILPLLSRLNPLDYIDFRLLRLRIDVFTVPLLAHADTVVTGKTDVSLRILFLRELDSLQRILLSLICQSVQRTFSAFEFIPFLLGLLEINRGLGGLVISVEVDTPDCVTLRVSLIRDGLPLPDPTLCAIRRIHQRNQVIICDRGVATRSFKLPTSARSGASISILDRFCYRDIGLTRHGTDDRRQVCSQLVPLTNEVIFVFFLARDQLQVFRRVLPRLTSSNCDNPRTFSLQLVGRVDASLERSKGHRVSVRTVPVVTGRVRVTVGNKYGNVVFMAVRPGRIINPLSTLVCGLDTRVPVGSTENVVIFAKAVVKDRFRFFLLGIDIHCVRVVRRVHGRGTPVEGICRDTCVRAGQLIDHTISTCERILVRRNLCTAH